MEEGEKGDEGKEGNGVEGKEGKVAVEEEAEGGGGKKSEEGEEGKEEAVVKIGGLFAFSIAHFFHEKGAFCKEAFEECGKALCLWWMHCFKKSFLFKAHFGQGERLKA